MPREGGDGQLITKFDADVTDVAGFDEKAGYMYLRASPDNAGQRYLYRTRLDGSGTPERVTPPNQPGTHRYDVSPNGKLAFHTYSEFERVPVTEVIELPSQADARADRSGSGGREGEAAAQSAGGVLPHRDWRRRRTRRLLLKPPTFDATKKYPVLFYVYGEPAGQTVVDRGAERSSVPSLARRRLPRHQRRQSRHARARGRTWRKAVYGPVGVLLIEQAEALRSMRRGPFVDPRRVAVWGWSGGGTNTLNCHVPLSRPLQGRHGGRARPGSAALRHDLPGALHGPAAERTAGYKLGSAINFAEGLQGQSAASCTARATTTSMRRAPSGSINRLIELGKPFDLDDLSESHAQHFRRHRARRRTSTS